VYTSPWDKREYPRIQILTVPDLLGGKDVARPDVQGMNVTFRQAPRHEDQPAVEDPLF